MAQLIHRHTHMPIIRCSEKVYAYLRAVACMLTCAHCTAVSNKSGVHVNYALAERSAECALQQFNPGWTLARTICSARNWRVHNLIIIVHARWCTPPRRRSSPESERTRAKWSSALARLPRTHQSTIPINSEINCHALVALARAIVHGSRHNTVTFGAARGHAD